MLIVGWKVQDISMGVGLHQHDFTSSGTGHTPLRSWAGADVLAIFLHLGYAVTIDEMVLFVRSDAARLEAGNRGFQVRPALAGDGGLTVSCLMVPR